jgi:gamma-glutamyltranspeptidase / glutathione hydrolase
VLAPAIGYAQDGFPVSPFAAQAIGKRAATSPDAAAMTADGVVAAGRIVRRPGVARVLADIVSGGHDAAFGGELGAGSVAASAGLIRPADLVASAASWRAPIALDVFGHRIWSPAPPSQGYLTLSAAWIAESCGLDAAPDDPAWAHTLVESMRQAAFDRPEVLWDGADATALLAPERLAPRAAAISPDRAAVLADRYRQAGTTYLCAVDSDGTAVSLMQSNCMSFGSGIVAGGTGVWLQNRGIGFSLTPGHPAELAPGRRPAHTLAPAMITDTADGFVAALGSRGGDSQPQIVLQLAARLLLAGESPAQALAAGRFILRGADDETAFDTWGSGGRVRVDVEGQLGERWAPGLIARGHSVTVTEPFGHPFGHAQVIRRSGALLIGAADPRATSGAALGY